VEQSSGHVPGTQIQPGQRAQRTDRFRVHTNELIRHAPRRLTLLIFEEGVDRAAVILKSQGTVTVSQSEVTRLVQRKPLVSWRGALRLLF
jgi:hypothetical protein